MMSQEDSSRLFRRLIYLETSVSLYRSNLLRALIANRSSVLQILEKESNQALDLVNADSDRLLAEIRDLRKYIQRKSNSQDLIFEFNKFSHDLDQD